MITALALVASVAATSPILTSSFVAEIQSKASWTAGINERFLNATREDIQKLLGTKIVEGKLAAKSLPVWQPATRVELPTSVSSPVMQYVAFDWEFHFSYSVDRSEVPLFVLLCDALSITLPPFRHTILFVCMFSCAAQFDVRSNWPACTNITSHIEDQASCGSCWAVSSTETFQGRLCIATKGAVSL